MPLHTYTRILYTEPISYWKPPTRLAEAPNNSKYSVSPRCIDEAISSLLYDKFKAKLEGNSTENKSNSNSNKSNSTVLPIFHAKDDILRQIEENQTVLISGTYIHIYTCIKNSFCMCFIFLRVYRSYGICILTVCVCYASYYCMLVLHMNYILIYMWIAPPTSLLH